jgi:hypothetical protein
LEGASGENLRDAYIPPARRTLNIPKQLLNIGNSQAQLSDWKIQCVESGAGNLKRHAR